jgi:YhcH/YjgK/YiaL family protein
MIIDKLTNANMYDKLHPRLKMALQFLQKEDLNALEVGTYQIEEDKIFVMVQEYETKQPGECRWEAHYQYTDIQYVIKGSEKMGYTSIEETELEEAIEEKDLMFLKADGDLFVVTEGSFAIFTPKDAHMPGLCVDQPQPVRKAVVKVLCD